MGIPDAAEPGTHPRLPEPGPFVIGQTEGVFAKSKQSVEIKIGSAAEFSTKSAIAVLP